MNGEKELIQAIEILSSDRDLLYRNNSPFKRAYDIAIALISEKVESLMVVVPNIITSTFFYEGEEQETKCFLCPKCHRGLNWEQKECECGAKINWIGFKPEDYFGKRYEYCPTCGAII